MYFPINDRHPDCVASEPRHRVANSGCRLAL